jgi:hypothetical protein
MIIAVYHNNNHPAAKPDRHPRIKDLIATRVRDLALISKIFPKKSLIT